jgi:putative transposase
VSVTPVSVGSVKQVIKLRVLPSKVEGVALYETLRSCNAAALWLSQQMHTTRVFRKIDAQHRFYAELRERFGLGAQPAIRVIGKVADAYAALHANIATGAAVSIWTVAGRLKNVEIVGAPKHLMLLRTCAVGETDLIYCDGKWFLHATIEAPEVPLSEPTNGFVGVDMGIVNIATTSTGKKASGARLNSYRKRQTRLRKRLQAKKTSSARRLLKRRRRKEARFAADINHQISKRIVAEAERTGCGIAVEQLTGIRDRVRLRKPQRATLHTWAFAELGSFLAYKAKKAGVAFVEVDPAYTSQTCSACGWVDKKNRRSQAVFECGRCRFVGHADHNAAINIATRGVERWGEVMRPHAAPTLTAS